MIVKGKDKMKKKKLKIGVLFGGKSGEHEVSINSALSIINAINKERYDIIPIGITKNGNWLSLEDSLKALNAGMAEEINTKNMKKHLLENKLIVSNREKNQLENSELERFADIIFPALHGPYGEDGTVQGFLELVGVPYVGSEVAASSIAMDKDLMKKIFQQAKIPQTNWITIKRKNWKREKSKVLEKIENKLTYPMFVKPTNLGSSVGINKAIKRTELIQAIEIAASYNRKVIIEESIENAIEVECGVLGNDEPEVSVVGEIQPAGEFYDYNSKYIDEHTRLIIPARINNKITKKIQEIARLAYLAIDAAGFARVDFFVQKAAGNFHIYINEINTIPGFTKTSMFPRLWEKSGIGFSALIDRLIQLAIERYEDKRINKAEYCFDIRKK